MILSGTIQNRETGEYMQYVTVALKNTNYGTFTNERGEFKIKNLPAGNYTLIISNLGFEVIEQNIALIQDLDFSIALTPKTYQYKGVEVVAIKPKSKNKWIVPASIIGILLLISKLK